jgi:hypothetical protein
MGAELRHDWNRAAPRVPEDDEAARVVAPAAPRKNSRKGKMFLVALAAAIILVWAAFLGTLFARLVGSVV